MKVLKLFIMGVGTTSLLMACSSDSEDDADQSDDSVDTTEKSEEMTNELVASADTDDDATEDETEEEIADDHEMLEVADALESYEADVTITAKLDENTPEFLDLYIRAIDGDSPQLHIRAEDTDRTIHTDGKTYHNNGNEWVDITGDVDFEQLHRITYMSAAELFVELESMLNESEEEGTLIYTYSGSDADVYELFEDFFGVSFGVVDTSNNDTEVQIEVDSDTHYITHIDFKSVGEDNEGTFSLESTVEFLAFDSVEDIEAPAVAE